MSCQDDLIELERALWQGGPDAYRAHVEDHCITVFGQGAGQWSRDEIAAMAAEGRWRHVRIEPRAFSQLSETVAAVAYDCRAERSSGEAYHALIGSVYVRRGEGWKLAFHQQTPVQD